MSIPIKPGKESTEHARAWRAEVFGFLLGLVGLVLLLAGQGSTGVALCAISAAVVLGNAASYFAARSAPKAAAVRRPADQAPRI